MSKTTRPTEKARPETIPMRVASVKEKNSEKKPHTASKKQTAGRVSTTPPIQATSNSGQKAAALKKPAVSVKFASAAQSTTPVPPISEDSPSQLLRRNKTTASALAQLEKGIELLYRKDFKKAISELQSLIEKYKNETEITASARSYLDIGRRGEARQKKAPPAAQNQTYALGVLEHNRTNYDKAIVYFRQSLEIYPHADYIYYSIAASLALKGDGPAAVENLRKAVELNRDSLVHAKNDPDFTSLENNKEFLELLGIPASRHR